MKVRTRFWASPLGVRAAVLRERARDVRSLPRETPRWRAIARASRPDTLTPRVYYGIDRLPSRYEQLHGGLVKFQSLSDQFANTPRGFNILYLGSSSYPPDAWVLARLSRRRGAAFVWSQNGVAYPAWAGAAYVQINRPRSRLFRAADHVFFQSEFCRVGAERYYGPRTGPSEILHNPVDVRRFSPQSRRPRRPLTILVAGTHTQAYRLETAVHAVALVAREQRSVRLRIAGRFRRALAEAIVARHDIADRVELLGPYTQTEAPALMRTADILLHTQYNDACPSLVLEALASGLPVVYSASGGTPELVGDEAGVGVPAPLDWDRVHPPDPEALAEGVVAVAEELEERTAAARARALERFALDRWIERHAQVFQELLT